jgi:NAD(P)-dependent dehydrogenase (short-subunit alcohol dehydrogenase family)
VRGAVADKDRADPFRKVPYDPLNGPLLGGELADEPPFDSVCWAQGANMSDSIREFDSAAHLELYRVNCLYVLESMAALVGARMLSASGARLCIVSSIWQEQARPNKLSYTMSKAAVGGLVRAASVDLAAHGHLVNAVLPGALDTPMTRAQLTSAQIESMKRLTPFNRLPDLNTLIELILFLCSDSNSSISGQSISVDLGAGHSYVL